MARRHPFRLSCLWAETKPNLTFIWILHPLGLIMQKTWRSGAHCGLRALNLGLRSHAGGPGHMRDQFCSRTTRPFWNKAICNYACNRHISSAKIIWFNASFDFRERKNKEQKQNGIVSILLSASPTAYLSIYLRTVYTYLCWRIDSWSHP